MAFSFFMFVDKKRKRGINMNNMTVFTKDFFDVVKPLSTMARKAAVNEENGVDTYIFEAQGARCRLHAYMIEVGVDDSRPSTEIIWNNIPLFGEKSRFNVETYEMEPYTYGLYSTFTEAIHALSKKLSNKEVKITSEKSKEAAC